MTIWPEGWHASTDQERQGLEGQLRKEIGAGHVLQAENVRLLARRHDQDDALFALDDKRVAQVHLTWRRSGPEIDPRFPETAIFDTIEEWRDFIASGDRSSN